MEIKPEEVQSVKIIGRLFDQDVKLVKTHGGFNIAIGLKDKRDKKAKALAAGNHQAIVSHHLSKTFGSDFQPAMFKSEADKLENVQEKTSLLNSDAINKGMELYVLEKNCNYSVVLTKHNVTVGEYKMERDGDSLKINNKSFNKSMLSKEDTKSLAKSMSAAIEDLAYEINVDKLIK